MVHYFSVLNGTRPLTCMHNVLVLNFAKRAGKRVPSPLLVVINKEQKSPSHMVPEKSDKLWLVINKGEEECSRSSMGAALKSFVWHGR